MAGYYEDEEYDSYPEAIPFPDGSQSGFNSRSVSATQSASGSAGHLTPQSKTPSNMGVNDDAASIKSSDYLMDMIPENITLKDGATITSAKRKEFILPATDDRSPYFVSVPIPVISQSAVADKGEKGLEKSSRSKTVIGDTEGYDGQFVREYPTDMLIDRFYKWKKILKSLIVYLREVAYAQEQFARINNQLRNSVKFPFLTDLSEGSNKIVDPLGQAPKKKEALTMAQKRKQKEQEELGGEPPAETPNPSEEFRPVQATDSTSASSGFLRFGSGSIQDIQVILKKYHVSLANQQFKISKEIVTTVIPKLEDIKKDLSFKIKEIKDLNGDFKTNINYHLKTTGNLLKKYIAACKFVDRANYLDDVKDKLKPKHDPYLLKLQLDLQIKRQIAEENYLQEAFVNLQSSGLQLEKIIYGRIQHVLQRYSTLIDSEARLMIKNLCQELQYGILAKPPAMEWDNFVSHHPLCLLNWQSTDPIPQPRSPANVIYPNMKSPMSKCIRAGYFLIKSESSRSTSSTYHKGYFILTSTYIHQFHSSDFFKPKKAATGQSSIQFQFQPNVYHNYSNNAVNTKKVSEKSGVASGHNGVVVESTPNSRHNEIIPIVSIPLSQCTLVECTDKKFVIEGKAEFSNQLVTKVPKKAVYKSISQNTTSSLQKPLNAAIHNSSKYTQDPSKLLHKANISKLVKGAKSKTKQDSKAVQKTSPEKEVVKPVQKVYATENVKWTFKMISQEPNEDEIKYFKKWVVDIKNLTKLPNPRDRFDFIEERLMKTYSRNASVADQGKSTAPVTSGRSDRPSYIPLGNNNFRSNFASESSSGMNTPAIDDQGNLVTFGQKPSVSSPHYSYHSDQSNKSNQRPLNSLPGSRNLSPLPLASPASVASDSSGGYFAIPVSKMTSHPNSTSNVNDYSNIPSPNPNSGSSTPYVSNSGYFAPVQSTGVVPKVKVNNEDMGGGTNSGNVSPSPYNTLRKNISTGSIPTLSSENSKGDSLYKQNNSSTNLLAAGSTSRVSAVRKHKKNVSFSSLNSLMFSKKGSQYNGQIINGISENSDHEGEIDENTGKIKLTQSIYS
ncbi:Activator of SKN7 protein 10 [Nakaseomyces bracarensis]|uniref:Activator of SKN7 protein 10 n=1 Tax=Nakaseomyces bracarensis TaxID=273131 RepID=A0ABR4NR45_9SACH